MFRIHFCVCFISGTPNVLRAYSWDSAHQLGYQGLLNQGGCFAGNLVSLHPSVVILEEKAEMGILAFGKENNFS